MAVTVLFPTVTQRFEKYLWVYTSVYIVFCKHTVCDLILICSTNTGSSNNHLELPLWAQIVLAVISVILLVTIGCVCRKCCIYWGCITGNKDDDNEGRRGRKKIPKGKVSAISNTEMSPVNVQNPCTFAVLLLKKKYCSRLLHA